MSCNRIRLTPGHLGIPRLLSFQTVHSIGELQKVHFVDHRGKSRCSRRAGKGSCSKPELGRLNVRAANTLILGVLLRVFATIGVRTPVWAIVLQAFLYGAFTSLQYTSMNTLVFADIEEKDASSASSIASTMQQMSISFGVAAAGLATALFVPSTRSDPTEMIQRIHKALIALGILTIVSTIAFRSLRSGDDVSLHKVLHPGG
jgi:hypothetical protein